MNRPVRLARLAEGHDERNLARLSLVLANNRVPSTLTTWTKEFKSTEDLGTSISVTCTAPRQDVVPHGSDNDVLLGLVNAYINAGMPESGLMRLTAYQLLTLSCLPTTQAYHDDLLRTLRRFQGTVYRIRDSWYDNAQYRYRDINTSLILKFTVVDRAQNPEAFEKLRAESLLEITLDSDLTASIRRGFIRPLDLTVLKTLKQPLARLLFRVLSEQRHPHDAPASVTSFRINLRTWAQHLGILDDRAFRIRRTLEPAHQQLTAQGFLQDVEYVGRGDGQDVLYTFKTQTDDAPAVVIMPPADPATTALLTKRGVNHSTALKYAAQLGPDTVRQHVATFDAMIARGYPARSRAGLLVDLLKNPEKYETAAPPSPPPRPRPADPEPLLEPARTPATARVLLTPLKLPSVLERLAIDLFVDHLVTMQELLDLRAAPDPKQVILLWQSRSSTH